jgi:cobalt-zinc-cadmium efflux system membrane fusion protein
VSGRNRYFMSTARAERGPARFGRPFLLAILLLTALCGDARAEAGLTLAPRLESKGSAFELLATAKGNTLTLYLDDVKTNEPVAGAQFEIEAGDGTIELAEAAPGVYRGQADWLTRPGSVDVVITVKAGARSDLLGGTLKIAEPVAALGGLVKDWGLRFVFLAGFVVGVVSLWLLRRLLRPRPPVAVPALIALLVTSAIAGPALAMPAGPGHSHGPDDVSVEVAPDNLPADSPRRLPDGSLFVPKPAQRVLAIRTILTAISEMPVTNRVFGRIIPDPTASGRVQAGIPGKIDPADGKMFIVGQHVERGQVVSSIVPIINPVDNANIAQQIGQIDGELRQIGDMLEQASKGEIPPLTPRQVETMRLDMMSLRQRRQGISLVMNDRDTLRIDLRAPSTGLIAISNVVAGQIVEAKDILFEVIDPDRLWVEAAAFDMNVVNNIAGATAVVDTGGTYELTYVGRAPRRRQQAIPVNFKINKPDATLTVGSPVNVFIRGRDKQTGIVLPQRAITTTASGQPIVFEHVSAEKFVPILVRTEAVDGENAIVQAGLEPGRRIVVDGAGLLGQVR